MQGFAKAMVVNCSSRPTLLGLPVLGHVGWGFEYPDGSWCVGSMEGDGWEQGNRFNGFWVRRAGSLAEALQTFSNMAVRDAPYSTYKLMAMTPVAPPNLADAEAQVRRVAITRYDVFKYNCLDAVYDILALFGRNTFSGKPLPHPAQKFTPNDWYGHLNVIGHHFLPPAAGRQAAFAGAEMPLTGAVGELPSWRVPGNPDYIERTADPAHYVDVPVAPPSA